jgi:hypothetical protein
MGAAKPARSGLPLRSTATSIFPHVGQAFAIERDTIEKKSGKQSHEVAYGITS